ncbi:MAG: KEOPS complex N(6)-L-threonylcarbamoyladenine synthase Kae1 [Candidatus Woesearchaeota archaeon]
MLGIESTAHTFGVAIIKGKKILSNNSDSYISKDHGMIPYELAEHHKEVYFDLVKKSLDEANIKLKDINLISFSRGPGMGHALKIGSLVSKSIAYQNNIPLIGVNHCIAHLNIGSFIYEDINDPILLYVSGANTQVIAFESNKYRVFGETLDLGLGNLLDTFARYIGFGFPGGPKIYEESLKSNKYIKLPYVVKGMDVSFGGILTNLKQKFNSGKYTKADLCYSLQETVYSMMLEVTERAMAHTQKNELILGGGVACNKRLQEMAGIMCKERNAKLYTLENKFNVDNAIMIAWEGLLEYISGERVDTDIKPYERTDDIKFKISLSKIAKKI